MTMYTSKVTLFPYTTLFRSEIKVKILEILPDLVKYKKSDNNDGPSYSEYKSNIFMIKYQNGSKDVFNQVSVTNTSNISDRKSTRLNSSHLVISYAVLCLKKK